MNESATMSGPLLVPQVLAAFQAATGMGVRVVRTEEKTPLWACENVFCKLIRRHDTAALCHAMRPRTADGNGGVLFVRRCAAGLEHVALAVPGPDGIAPPIFFVRFGRSQVELRRYVFTPTTIWQR